MKCPKCKKKMTASYCEEGCCGSMLIEFECYSCELYHGLGIHDTYYDEKDYPKKEITMDEVSFYKDCGD